MNRKTRMIAGILALATLLGAGAAGAQGQKAANPFQGFSADNGKPVDVNSDSLEVRQNDQMAIFTGNVVAKQGDSTLMAPKLIVYYDNAAAGGGKPGQAGDKPAETADKPAEGADKPAAADPAAQGNSITRLEASGGVTVISQDQKATGDAGVFDMKANTATLTGNVVLTQGPNVIKGKQLVVDLKTGVARVQGGTTGLFMPGSQNKAK